MSRTTRAAGIAAAMLVAVFGTFHAGPSRAWETSPTLISPPASAEFAAAAEPSQPIQPVLASPADVLSKAIPAPSSLPAEPEARPTRSLAALVAEHATSQARDAEHECLATAVYYESKGEPLAGQLSVAEVVINRARSGRFASSICGVVKQRGQFSFVRGGRLPAAPRSSAAWRKAVAVAHIAREGLADGGAPRALFFHATRVRPGWSRLKRVATVGNHIFYR